MQAKEASVKWSLFSIAV